MGIRDFLERMRNKKSKYKEFEEDQKVQEKFEERKKSSNERELERFMKEEREDNIKKELEEFRNKAKEKAQYGNQIIKVKNMFAPENNKVSVLNSPRSVLNTENLFKHEKGVFFK